jgi:hypothetical protein
LGLTRNPLARNSTLRTPPFAPNEQRHWRPFVLFASPGLLVCALAQCVVALHPGVTAPPSCCASPCAGVAAPGTSCSTLPTLHTDIVGSTYDTKMATIYVFSTGTSMPFFQYTFYDALLCLTLYSCAQAQASLYTSSPLAKPPTAYGTLCEVIMLVVVEEDLTGQATCHRPISLSRV